MNSKNKFLFRLFLVLFTVSISAAAIPGEIINVYGLFGEVKASTVTWENKTETEEIAPAFEKSDAVRSTAIYNRWREIAIRIIVLIFCSYAARLPKRHTIVTLKVRMNN